VKGKWYNYDSDGQNPTSCCDSGEYYYFYDALGNVNGVLDDGGHYYRWEMDAFGNDLPSGNSFLDMDQPGAKEHLTGKMFDAATGLYYFAARWYDPQVGRFVSRDPERQMDGAGYSIGYNNPYFWLDPDGLIPKASFTGGLPYEWYADLPCENKPSCTKKCAELEWELITDEISKEYTRSFVACGSNAKLLKHAKKSECWTCDIRVGKRYNPVNFTPIIVGQAPFFTVHQWVECKLVLRTTGRSRKLNERPWDDFRSPILDNWWGSTINPGMSALDMRMKYLLPGDWPW